MLTFVNGYRDIYPANEGNQGDAPNLCFVRMWGMEVGSSGSELLSSKIVHKGWSPGSFFPLTN